MKYNCPIKHWVSNGNDTNTEVANGRLSDFCASFHAISPMKAYNNILFPASESFVFRCVQRRLPHIFNPPVHCGSQTGLYVESVGHTLAIVHSIIFKHPTAPVQSPDVYIYIYKSESGLLAGWLDVFVCVLLGDGRLLLCSGGIFFGVRSEGNDIFDIYDCCYEAGAFSLGSVLGSLLGNDIYIK
jgi:hypothetical protein